MHMLLYDVCVYNIMYIIHVLHLTARHGMALYSTALHGTARHGISTARHDGMT